MMTDLNLLEQAAAYVFDLLKDNLPDELVYHNYNHTKETVAAVEELVNHYELSAEEKEDLLLAAWFHDTGYVKVYKNHEDESVNIAREYLKGKISDQRMERISSLIASTHVNAEIKNEQEEILHDADYINIGKKEFNKRAQLLRIEWEHVLSKKYSELEWAEEQLTFLIKKRFKTAFALNKYGEQREKNIKKHRKLTEKLKNDHYKLHLKEKGIQTKQKKEGRGIETLYRSVYDYHINLSSIADNKANIMISINTIIVSLIITLFGSGYTFTGDGTLTSVRFVFPMAFLVISSVISMVFAIISARPTVTMKEKYELNNKSSSVLFFGNFAQLEISEFVKQIRVLKEKKDELYDSMSVDIYYLGSVLVRKYKLLTWSYNVFMGGFVICATGFLVIMLFSYS
jgi:predicted metal-dependent HD superfamily phosphohydrolase